MRTKIASAIAAITMAASGSVFAEARIGPELSTKLDQATSLEALAEPMKVIVTFNQGEDIKGIMQALGVPFLALKELPMVGASMTPAQIDALKNNPSVESIYYDAPLRYYNYNSGEITGGHYVHDNYGFTGKDRVIAVLDSGVDGTHPDLPMGDKVIQNVKLVGDLDLAGGVNSNIEGVPNTDTSSGHGTHVAGTVGGTGAASADNATRANYHDGIAPDSKIVGLGAGEAISILYSLQGFDYALANQERYNIDVITNSWGGGAGSDFDPHNPINKASFEAYKRGMVVTFAASNDGPGNDTLNRYAIAPWVINVAAGTPERHLANFSSRGVPGDEIKTPDITAPGSRIYSARALNTPLGAIGPVIDPENPDYYVYYATMSGTSMATPFVAGAAAVLLEANPNLSPDQIDQILKATADPMYAEDGRQYLPHEVGAGHINMKLAVEMAQMTEGKMRNFLSGDTEFATRGDWSLADDTHADIHYFGRWNTATDEMSFQSTIHKAKGKGKVIKTAFRGDRAKVVFGQSSKPGAVKVLVDGQLIDTVYLEANKSQQRIAINGLANGDHKLELRTVDGQVAFDRFEFDGDITSADITYVEETMPTIEGFMGPSASGDAGVGPGTDAAYTIDEHTVALDADIVSLRAVLSWEPFADIDFALADASGAEIASSASLDNPEVIEFDVTEAGDYTFLVKGYASAAANYKIEWVVTRAQ